MNDLTKEELLNQFCAWYCSGKKTRLENPFQHTEVSVNGIVVWENDDDEVDLCQYCKVKEFLRFMEL